VGGSFARAAEKLDLALDQPLTSPPEKREASR
jgi:hypothetical protein